MTIEFHCIFVCVTLTRNRRLLRKYSSELSLKGDALADLHKIVPATARSPVLSENPIRLSEPLLTPAS